MTSNNLKRERSEGAKKSNTYKMSGINNEKSVQLICCYKFQWTFFRFLFLASMDVGEFKSFPTLKETRNRVNGISFSFFFWERSEERENNAAIDEMGCRVSE